jgi:hypothetical protein
LIAYGDAGINGYLNVDGDVTTTAGQFIGAGTGLNGTAADLTAGTVTTINGRLTAGANVTISGAGTAASPYSIAAAGNFAPATSNVSISATLVHDACQGSSATLADNATRACVPGPGIMTAAEIRNQSLCRYENGELLLSSIPDTSSANVVVWDVQQPSAGLTFMVRFAIGIEPGTDEQWVAVGFSPSYTAGQGHRGAVQFKATASQGRIDIWTSRMNTYVGAATPPTERPPNDNTDTALRIALYGGGSSGDEVVIAIHYKSLTHQQYFIQGGKFASLGAVIGGDSWFLLDETFGDMTSVGNLYPYFGFQGKGLHRVRDVQILKTWAPNLKKMVAFDHARDRKGVHIPSLAKDPTTGLVVVGWHNGWLQFGATAYNDLKAAVQLGDGTWTQPQIIVADPAGADAVTFGHISAVKGQLWAIYALRTLTGSETFDGGVLTRRVLTINPSTGVITVGSAVTLTGINTGGQDQSFGAVMETASGRLILPYQNNSLTPRRQLFAYSDNDGLNWTRVDPFASVFPSEITSNYMAEGCLTREAGGAVGCYMRTMQKSWYSRSTDDGLTWSTPIGRTEFPMVASDGTRISSVLLPNNEALLIGSDHPSRRVRMTLWKINDAGQVIWKRPIGDINEDQNPYSEYSMMQYPVGLMNGDDFILAWSLQHGTNAYSTLGMSIRVSTHANPMILVSPESAGSVFRAEKTPQLRNMRAHEKLSYSTAPVPDISKGGLHHITLTASTAVIGIPLNPLPWDELTLVFVQGGAGSFTATFNAIFEFGGITPVWRTAVNATNTLKAYCNPLTNKWIVTSWN